MTTPLQNVTTHRRARVTFDRFAALLLAVFLAASVVPRAAAADELAIRVLSNRADLISGGDALVEVIVPPDVATSDVHVALNGADVTSMFGVSATGRFVGLVEGLVVGDNDVEAFVTPPTLKLPAQISITNHAIGGPVFSGEQLLPWVCARRTATSVLVTVPGTSLSANVTTRVSGLNSDPLDDQCDTPPTLAFFYQPKAKEGTSCTFTTTGSNPCFQAYDLTNPPLPADIANFTNDRGDTVKSIVVLEKGTIDRGIYQLVTFYDPTQPNTPQAPQRGWNGKLLWNFGASSGVSRFESPPGSAVFNDTALRRGYMVASASLTDHGTNSNDTLAAEMVMMLKEQITETYGEIRYTVGMGCSGGSILQYNIAAAYPGLLQGIQPNCTFPDTMTTAIEVTDCGLLTGRYYSMTANGSALSTAQRAAIDGHPSPNFCTAWVLSFLNFGNPSIASNCGSGWPSALTYDAVLRPQGVRCTTFDHDVSMLGTFIDTDGNTKANSPFDNVGVQYGLKALQNGVISAEQFVQLNEGVGTFNADLGWIPPARAAASAGTLHTVYTGGLVSDGRQLAKAAIIDLRGNQAAGGDIHMNWRAWEVRERLDDDYGDHANQLIWAYNGSSGSSTPGAALLLRSFSTLDTWLANIENDTSNQAIELKVRADKPSNAADLCLTNTGATEPLVDVGLGSPTCPIVFQSSPRQVAGGPLAENIFKCQLKPLDFSDPDYGSVTFTSDQQSRLVAIFPSGVCDWTKAGVGQVPADGWTTFENGPGGEPLGEPPISMSVPPVCGDGVVSGEVCDDGNTTSGDGCSATCTVELGFTCMGSPSVCTPVCGDGLIRGTEACDDGAANGTLPSCCSATCQFKPSGTACDDGNACTQTDTCRAATCIGTNFSWSGVLQPINGDGSSVFKLGSTIAVKFQLTGACAGTPNLTADIVLAKVSNSVVGIYGEATSTSAADTGNTFRYDPSADQYIYNLATKPLSTGTWQIAIDLGDGSGNRLVPLISLR